MDALLLPKLPLDPLLTTSEFEVDVDLWRKRVAGSILLTLNIKAEQVKHLKKERGPTPAFARLNVWRNSSTSEHQPGPKQAASFILTVRYRTFVTSSLTMMSFHHKAVWVTTVLLTL